MLLLSLGPQAISALLWHGAPHRFAGPDLAWLLFAPDMSSGDGEGTSVRYDSEKNIFLNNDLSG